MHWTCAPHPHQHSPPTLATEELLALTRKPESMAVPWDIWPRCGAIEKRQGVANVIGSSRRFTIWNSRQILESRSYCLLPRRGKSPNSHCQRDPREDFVDRRAGSYLWAEEQGAQTERGRKADAITVINTLNILPLAVGSFQCFRRLKPAAKLDEEKHFLPGSTDRQLPKSMEWRQDGQKHGQQRGKSPANPLWIYPQITHPATLISYREVSKEF